MAAYRGVPEFNRVVVAIDPAATSGEAADETGLIVVGKDANGHGYVLDDRSGRYPPADWARLPLEFRRSTAANNPTRSRSPIVASWRGELVKKLVVAGRRMDPHLRDYHHAAERIMRGAPQPDARC